MAVEHKDIMGKPLAADDSVVFCQAGSSKLMTVGTIARVLPKTVEVVFTRWDQWRRQQVTDSVFRSPEDVVRV